MKKIKRLEKFVDQHIIHKKLHQNVEQLGRARFVAYGLLASSLFVATHWFFIEVSGSYITPLKNFCNAAGTILGIVCLIIIRFSGNLQIPILLNLLLGMAFVVASSYYSGGIYSVDAFWLIVISMVAFMFLNRNQSVLILALCIGIYFFYYVAAINEWRDFRLDNETGGPMYDFVNIVFLLLFTSVVSYVYVSGLNKTKTKLKDLKDKQFNNIGTKYKYITENVSEIIALHTATGEVSYLSEGVKSILGYEPSSLLGIKYSELLGVKNFKTLENETFSCLDAKGKEVHLEIISKEISDELNTGDIRISIARDVTAKVLESKKLEALREQIANDFHDEMGNKLAAITLNSNVLSLQLGEEKEHQQIIQKIEDNSRSLYQNSRDFIWSIDPKSDKLDEIFLHLKDFGEDFLQSLSIVFSTDSPTIATLSQYKLPMSFGRHIILIFKEAITNAAKHSNCTTIELSIAVKNEQITIQLMDNGKNRKNQIVKKGKGLLSMKKRAEILNFQLKTEFNEKGGLVSVNGKLPKMGG